MADSPFWVIWPGNAVLSAVLWFVIAMPFLYAARAPGGPLRLAARWLLASAREMRERNRAVLLAQGGEETGQRIAREFERVAALVKRDLEGYPALQRKLLDEVTRVEEDYRQCGEVPPPPPESTADSGPSGDPPEHSGQQPYRTRYGREVRKPDRLQY